MFTLKCKHCGARFQTERPQKFCSPRCQYFGNKIAAFDKEQPATYDKIPNHCTLAILIAQECGPWRPRRPRPYPSSHERSPRHRRPGLPPAPTASPRPDRRAPQGAHQPPHVCPPEPVTPLPFQY
jgi:hypothetical protein